MDLPRSGVLVKVWLCLSCLSLSPAKVVGRSNLRDKSDLGWCSLLPPLEAGSAHSSFAFPGSQDACRFRITSYLRVLCHGKGNGNICRDSALPSVICGLTQEVRAFQQKQLRRGCFKTNTKQYWTQHSTCAHWLGPSDLHRRHEQLEAREKSRTYGGYSNEDLMKSTQTEDHNLRVWRPKVWNCRL